MLYKIYKKLLKYFGPQGWWPIGGIYNPFKKCFSEKEKFEVMVGAILTQNTAWNNVEKALSNLRRANLLDIKKISKINSRKLETLIKPSGFYKQKAVRLKNFVNSVRPIGLIENMSREEWFRINGIGPETADSILLYALGKPYFVVDAYTKRLVNRLGIFNSEKYEEIREFFEKNIPRSIEIYKEYHALIVALAKNFCKKNPECKNCPILKDCKYGMSKMRKKN
ncbi:MAG: endonuclease III domain-containing protein [Elusimicrobia bacterium]|nr:endonuclease III domain-containing protein [Elusimicrobiota bacterium]